MASNAISQFERVPQEVILNIFSYLRPEELAITAQVCRVWQLFSYDNLLWKAIEKRLPGLYPSLRIIDTSVWKACLDLKALGLEVDETALSEQESCPLNKHVHVLHVLKVLKKITPLVEDNAGMTILTIPKYLTLNKLLMIAESNQDADLSQIRHIEDGISQELGDIPTKKTYKVVITNSILKESKNLFLHEHEELVNKIGCEIPRILEISALIILTYKAFSTRLYKDTPWAFTRCIEQRLNRSLIAGGFSSEGFVIKSLHENGQNCGVGAQSKP